MSQSTGRRSETAREKLDRWVANGWITGYSLPDGLTPEEEATLVDEMFGSPLPTEAEQPGFAAGFGAGWVDGSPDRLAELKAENTVEPTDAFGYLLEHPDINVRAQAAAIQAELVEARNEAVKPEDYRVLERRVARLQEGTDMSDHDVLLRLVFDLDRLAAGGMYIGTQRESHEAARALRALLEERDRLREQVATLDTSTYGGDARVVYVGSEEDGP